MINMTAWETAYHTHRRVFYEAATETIRECPANYCLIVKRDGRWGLDQDKASTVSPLVLRMAMALHEDGGALAAALETLV